MEYPTHTVIHTPDGWRAVPITPAEVDALAEDLARLVATPKGVMPMWAADENNFIMRNRG